jgi:hypothetical protein
MKPPQKEWILTAAAALSRLMLGVKKPPDLRKLLMPEICFPNAGALKETDTQSVKSSSTVLW